MLQCPIDFLHGALDLLKFPLNVFRLCDGISETLHEFAWGAFGSVLPVWHGALSWGQQLLPGALVTFVNELLHGSDDAFITLIFRDSGTPVGKRVFFQVFLYQFKFGIEFLAKLFWLEMGFQNPGSRLTVAR